MAPLIRVFASIACVAGLSIGTHISPRPLATISGRVVSEEGNAPLRGARVTLSNQRHRFDLVTTTNDRGEFGFLNLDPGSYGIAAEADGGYLATIYGARPGATSGVSLLVRDGQRVDGLTLKLRLGASIEGHVRDEWLRPVSTIVSALRTPAAGGAVVATVSTATDGSFRFLQLEPGQYVVYASAPAGDYRPSQKLVTSSVDNVAVERGANDAIPAKQRDRQEFTVSGVFYPDSLDGSQASVISVASGDRIRGTDLAIRLIRTVDVEGVVSAADVPMRVIRVSLLPKTPFGQLAKRERRLIAVEAGRTFQFIGVLPGDYVLAVIASPTDGAPDYWNARSISVGDRDLTALTLNPAPTTKVIGAAQFRDTQKAGGWKAALVPRSAETSIAMTAGIIPKSEAIVDPDGRFDFPMVVPGTYYVTSRNLPSPAYLDVEQLQDHDGSVDIPAKSRFNFIMPIRSDRGSVGGKVQMSLPYSIPSEYSVVLFPTRRELWSLDPSRLAKVAISADGLYRFDEVPVGDYLLSVIVESKLMDFSDFSVLDAVAQLAVPVRVLPLKTTTQDLTIGTLRGR